MRTLPILLICGLTACGDPNPLYCQSMGDCRDPARPFCDLEGQHPGSEGLTNTCVPDPLILSVNILGDGSVTSFPLGIDCPANCDKSYEDGTAVTLSASPQNGSVFVGWSGACSGTGSCAVVVNGPTNVTATFATEYEITVAIGGSSGAGSVTSSPAGIDCPANACTATFAAGTPITLSPTEASGSSLVGWTGEASCSGFGDCSFVVDATKTITANFEVAGEHQWAVLGSSPPASGGYAQTVAFDSQGNVFVAGQFEGASFRFGGGPLASAGLSDMFLAKLDSLGNLQWLKQWGGTGNDAIVDVLVDSSDNVLFVANFGANVDVGGTLHTGPSSLVAKISGGTGNVAWSRAFTGTGTVNLVAIEVDSMGRLAIAGSYGGNIALGAIDAVQTTNEQMLVAWLDTQGTPLWLASYGGAATDTVADIAAGQDGSLLLAGKCSSGADFNGPSPGGNVAAGWCLANISPVGGYDWARTLTAANGITTLAMDTMPTGDFVITGVLVGDVNLGGDTFSSTNPAMYLGGFSQTGLHSWSVFFATAIPSAVSVDAARGNITVTGRYRTAFDFGGPLIPAIGGGQDVFTVSFDELGQHRWSRGFGTTMEPAGPPPDAGFGIAVDSQGRVAVVGRLWGDTDFGNGTIVAPIAAQPFVSVYGP